MCTPYVLFALVACALSQCGGGNAYEDYNALDEVYAFDFFVKVTVCICRCMECICARESEGCRPIGCRKIDNILRCGYFAITESYYRVF